MSILNSTTPTANFGDYGDSVYRTKQYMYPTDLLSVDPNKNEYGGQYMMIYINITSDSKFTRDDDKGSVIPNVTSRIGKELSGLKNLGGKGGIGQTILSGSIATAAAGVGIASGVSGVGAIGAGVLGALGTAFVGSLAGQFDKPRKRLQSAIALHIPNNIAINYGVTYGEASADIMELAGRGLNKLVAAKSDLTKLGEDNGTDLLVAGGLKAIGGTDAGKVVGKLAGLAYNPKKEQIFEGVPFRTFTYNYEFYPRSEAEAENVKRIIDELKYHMHPGFKDNAGFVFEYPAEFDIFFMHKGIENKFIHKHRSAVLESMSVNYAPNGAYTAFANGSPTQYQIALTFKEVSIITKDALESSGEVKRMKTNSNLASAFNNGNGDTF
jgi:hypothetical protein